MRTWLLVVVGTLAVGCDCRGSHLVSDNGGALRVTLVGVARTATSFSVDVSTGGGDHRLESFGIDGIPMVRDVSDLPAGRYAIQFIAHDTHGKLLVSLWQLDVDIVARKVTEVTVDLSLNEAGDVCDGVDNDHNDLVDDGLVLPLCTVCAGGALAVPADDERCGVVRCDGLDTYELRGDNSAAGTSTCVRLQHDPLTVDRCVGSGQCASPSGPRCASVREVKVAEAGVCQTIADCLAGQPSVNWVPEGTSCGKDKLCAHNLCVPTAVDSGVVDAGVDAGLVDSGVIDAGVSNGCADGTREGFLSVGGYPDIAACSGAWTVPGVTRANLAPTCARNAGNSSSNRQGTGRAAADLCAAGFHVCRGKDEVGLKANGSCADAVPMGAEPNTLFFAITQPSQNNTTCEASGDNDVFGCGNLGTQLSSGKNCGVLTRSLASTQAGHCGFNEAEPPLGPYECQGPPDSHLHEGALVTKHGCTTSGCSFNGNALDSADKGGVLCCRD